MESKFLNKCLEMLQSKEVQSNILIFMKPFIKCILDEIYPYIYLSILLVFVCFFLILAIFLLLIRKNYKTIK